MTSQPAPRRILAWLAEALSEAGPKLDLGRAMHDICKAAGAKNASFLMRHVPGVVSDDPFEINTFGESWRRHLEANTLALADPLIPLTDRILLPVDLSVLPRS